MQRHEISGSESLNGKPGERWTFQDADASKPAPTTYRFRAFDSNDELIAEDTATGAAEARRVAASFPFGFSRIEMTVTK